MLIPHLDVEATACELGRRQRVADALRAAELRVGSTPDRPREIRSLDISGHAIRLIGWLRRLSPERTAPNEQAVIRPSGPATGS